MTARWKELGMYVIMKNFVNSQEDSGVGSGPAHEAMSLDLEGTWTHLHFTVGLFFKVHKMKSHGTIIHGDLRKKKMNTTVSIRGWTVASNSSVCHRNKRDLIPL